MANIGNYHKINFLAEGGFAIIYQAEHLHLKEKACLKQNKENTAENIQLLEQEARILWKLREHHSIPHAKDFFPVGDGSYVMVMDYIDGKALDELIGNKKIPPERKMHPEDACYVTERLLGALYYSHYNGVVHSDIKPGNIIIEPKKRDIKLIDFGLSVYRPSRSTMPIGYTEAYVAPEVEQGKPPIPETDLYGAGLVMLYALGGNPITKQFPADTPLPIREFCSQLIRHNPMDRPNWGNTNLVEKLSDVRYEVFGRRHTK